MNEYIISHVSCDINTFRVNEGYNRFEVNELSKQRQGDYIDRLRVMREDQDISQTAMSKRLGLGPAAYGMYETRRRRMTVETFAEACRILGASADEILDIPKEEE
ncbi:helix-turn-helix domain-containing protein [Ruthenibacterium lactatiformans]|uniref:helix-turn-helix domain-containing protein n=1 Tax=Ruthenibacterium lactatiformans TaxID=1550024 RepID=UPI00242BEB80|nr:helix-turn-helix transcriptional regulator [Ruthenibacterium lactatiformans]